MVKLLRFLNIIAVILLLVNWMALTDISRNAENLSGEWSFVNVSNIIILIVLALNIIFLSIKKKSKPEEK